MSLLLFPINVALSFLVMSSLWGWFAVPLGAPDLHVAHVWGLAMLASYPTAAHHLSAYVASIEDDRDKRDTLKALGTLIMLLLYLGFGGFASWWMS